MDEKIFIKVIKSKLNGNLVQNNKTLKWILKDNIILYIYIGSFESCIEAYFSKNNKEKQITHWHTANDDLLEEIESINSNVLVIKKNCLGETMRIISKEDYKLFANKNKNDWFSKYYINDFS